MSDAKTGLPQLPKGQFWRISKPNIIGYHEIQLRKKFWGIFSIKVEYTQVAPHHMEPSRIREAAGYVLSTVQEHDYGMSYVGNYPPKKLNN